MISLTLCGLFLFGTNPTHVMFLLISSPMRALNLTLSLQTDNGTEFVNSTLVEFLARHGIHLRMSCPYTSPQNGKAERALRTLNDITRTLLFQAHIPPSYWAEGLAAATYLHNRRPCQPSFTKNQPPIPTFGFTASCAIPTNPRRPLISLHLVRRRVFS